MRKSLTRKQVVKKRLEIDAIFRNGKKYSAKQVKLLVADNNLEINRIIVIPNFKSGLDFAFVVYPGKALDYWTQKGNLTTLFEKANLYKI
jgi:ribonuclease P protein component